jgi:hypothetical protein
VGLEQSAMLFMQATLILHARFISLQDQLTMLRTSRVGGTRCSPLRPAAASAELCAYRAAVTSR